jgi:hypothetical protein
MPAGRPGSPPPPTNLGTLEALLTAPGFRRSGRRAREPSRRNASGPSHQPLSCPDPLCVVLCGLTLTRRYADRGGTQVPLRDFSSEALSWRAHRWPPAGATPPAVTDCAGAPRFRIRRSTRCARTRTLASRLGPRSRTMRDREPGNHGFAGLLAERSRLAWYGAPVGSVADRAAALRREKLKLLHAQIDNGSLTVRKMTAAERKLNPPRPSKRLPTSRPA